MIFHIFILIIYCKIIQHHRPLGNLSYVLDPYSFQSPEAPERQVLFCYQCIWLAIGLASCLLIILYIQDELSYDKFHQKSD